MSPHTIKHFCDFRGISVILTFMLAISWGTVQAQSAAKPEDGAAPKSATTASEAKKEALKEEHRKRLEKKRQKRQRKEGGESWEERKKRKAERKAKYKAEKGSAPKVKAKKKPGKKEIIPTIVPGMEPKISFEQKEIDLGQVSEGIKVDFKFPFKNEGKGDLFIHNVKKTCGCTRAETTKKVLKPGETANITGTFDTKGRPGKQSKTITVTTNDPTQESISLKFVTQVDQMVEIKPRYVRFNTMEPGESKTQTVEIINHTKKSITLSNPESSSESVKVRVLEPANGVVGASQKATIEVTSTAGKVGQYYARVTVNSDYPDMPKIQFNVNGRVSEDVAPQPHSVAFSSVRPDTKPERTVRLISRSKTDFKITSVETEEIPVKVSYEPLTKQKGYQLTVTLETQGDPGTRKRGKILVKIEHPRQQTIEIPVMARFQK